MITKLSKEIDNPNTPVEYTDEQLHALWEEERRREEIIDARSEADQMAIENEAYNWNLN